jgi:hypothetical protein
MTTSTQTRSLSDFIGYYGVLGSMLSGLLSEHEYLFTQAGGTIRTLANGNRVALVPRASGRSLDAYPIVCSELVEDFHPEDGERLVVRCGLRVEGDHFACSGHQEEIDSYRSMSECERFEAEGRDAY